MPRLHPETGLAACGTAGGRVSFGSKSGAQTVLCDGGCTFWLNADEIAYLGPGSGSWATEPSFSIAQRVNIHTGQRQSLDARECHFLAAAAGRWQAAIAGQGHSFGSCGEFPGGTVSRAMTDGRGAASNADGTIALVDVYQGENNGFRLGRPDGRIFPPFSTRPIADGTEAFSLYVIDQDRAIWPTAFAWGTFGIDPVPLWLKGSSGRACWCEMDGFVVLVHWMNSKGLVARRSDSRFGKVLSSADQEFHYDAVPWRGGIRVAWARIDGEPPGSLEVVDWDCSSDLVELEPLPKVPTFFFTHPVIVAPFKDPAGSSGATHEICVNAAGMKVARPHFAAADSMNDRLGPLLGIYSEASRDPTDDLKLADFLETRLMLCRDQPGHWALPTGLRRWDIPMRELYLVQSETLEQSVERWKQEVSALLADWRGDVGVVAMFYCQGGIPPNELWLVAEVCAGLAHLSDIVNMSPRIKVVAAFSFLRANGIVGHVELRQAFDNLKAAGASAGVAQLLPVDLHPVPPKPVPRPYAKHKEYRMPTTQTVLIIGPAGKAGRPDKPNTGPWGSLNRGWHGIIWDGDPNNPTDKHKFELSMPDSRHQLYHAGADGFFGADATGFATKPGSDQFYIKPAAETRGGYEAPVIYEGNVTPGLLSGQVEYVDDQSGQAYVSCGFAIKVLS
jgi:hypothetical protein